MVALFSLTGNLTSCKSHKKIAKQEQVFIGETPIDKKKETHKEKGLGNLIVEESLTWIGTPYKYGCSEKGIATDCSGLVIRVFDEVAAIKLPRQSLKQAEFCDDLEEREIEPGDLVFFATGRDKTRVSHVGVMIDRERFIHASSSKGVVISNMQTPYYRRTFIKYGRVPR